MPRTSISIAVPMPAAATARPARTPSRCRLLERRRQRPARDLAAADDRVALARYPRAGEARTARAARRGAGSAVTRGRDRLGADEARRLLAAPAEAGLDRPARLHQVVAVEVEAGLQAQRVARGEAGGRDAGGEQGVPERWRIGRARRAARRRPRPCSRCRSTSACAPATVSSAVRKRAGQRVAGCEQRGEQLARVRPLHRQHRVVVDAVEQLDVEAARVPAQPREVLLVVRRRS